MNINSKINIYFFNTLCSETRFKELFDKHDVKSSNAPQAFFSLLAEGLAKQKNTSVIVNTLLPINSKDQKKIFWESITDINNNIIYKTIPLINLPIIRNIFIVIYSFFYVLTFKFKKNCQNVVLVDYLRYSLNIAIKIACIIRRIKIIAVVTDMPGLGVIKQSPLGKLRNLLALKITYDYYICVTDSLNSVLNKKNKPSLVIESFCNPKLSNIQNNIQLKYPNRVIVYAGSLYEKYGLKNLIEAFKLIKNQDICLWFYGYGPYKDEIITQSIHDKRIDYKGILTNSEMINVLMKSTILVNPRPTNEEYTKFSYPSKNLEYMSTGTPLLTTKLHGIPADHYPYIYLIDRYDIDGIYESLSKLLSLSNSELHKFGLNAQKYVLNEKTNIVQARKIIEKFFYS